MQPPISDALYRVAIVDRGRADDEHRSFPIILATEAAVQTYDFSRDEIVDEVLHLDGMEIPQQVPMVDTHERDSVRSVLGSIRELRVEKGHLLGRAYFASDPESQRAYQNYRDGHLTDFSVGARRLEAKYEGRTKHVTRSRLIEGSAVVRGADPNSKAMLALRAYADPESVRTEIMDAKLRELLVSRGLAADANDGDTLGFLKRELDKADSGIDPKDALEAIKKLNPTAERNDGPNADEITRAERKRVEEIDEMCRQHGVEDADRSKYLKDGIAADEVARAILRKRLNPESKSIGDAKVSKDAADKFYAAASHAIVARAISDAGLNPLKAKGLAESRGDFDAVQRSEALASQIGQRNDDARDFRYMGFGDIARVFCEKADLKVSGLPKHEVIRRAIKLDQGDYLARDGGPGYHTTGSFPQLMLDAVNKTLLAAYDEASQSYTSWVRTAPPAADFKSLNRIRFGELPDPQIVAENEEYQDASTSDQKESYRVEKYGQLFSISMEAMVNDDLNAISRIPAMQGNAMRRKINKVVYSILTANGALSDGIALFHASSHGANLDTTALSVAALNVGYSVMGLQTGLSGTGTILNLEPQYLITGRTLAPTAMQILGSLADPAAGGSAAGNSNTFNIYGPNGPRMLQLVVDGQLDATSTTAWYLAASPSQIDTIELCFLQGEESPVTDREESFTVDAIKYKIRQSFAAKAIDYRGLYQGNT